jgi:excisionase family DNA binding protein
MTGAYGSGSTERLLLKKNDVVRLLDISARTLDRMLATGQLPRVRLGGCTRIRVQDVQALVERSRDELPPAVSDGTRERESARR